MKSSIFQKRDPKSNIEFIIRIGLIVTLIFACLTTYLLLKLNLYSLYFKRPEMSYLPLKTRNLYINIVSIGNFVIMLGLMGISVFKFWKTKSFFIWTPIVVFTSFILLMSMSQYYPDSQSQYLKGEYLYWDQTWYREGNESFKRFRSEKPVSNYGDLKAIVWELDSTSHK
jgi:hypothetical protein